MDLLKKLFSSAKDERKTETWDQTEAEAIVDLLLLALYADNHLSLAEDIILKEEIDKIDWNSSTSIDLYLAQATARARNAASSEETEREFMSDIADRIASRPKKAKALDLLSKLFYSDGTEESEKRFTSEFRNQLGM